MVVQNNSFWKTHMYNKCHRPKWARTDEKQNFTWKQNLQILQNTQNYLVKQWGTSYYFVQQDEQLSKGLTLSELYFQPRSQELQANTSKQKISSLRICVKMKCNNITSWKFHINQNILTILIQWNKIIFFKITYTHSLSVTKDPSPKEALRNISCCWSLGMNRYLKKKALDLLTFCCHFDLDLQKLNIIHTLKTSLKCQIANMKSICPFCIT